MTAREIRERAWGKLGENGGWGTAIGGCVLAFFVSYGINSLVQSFCGATAFLQMAQDVQAGTLSQEELMKALPKFMGALCVVTLVAYYVNAVFRYGLSALSIAVMRGGARIGHAFSGFGKGWSTLWLMALAHLYIFCWTLLFVIPGIRAAFSSGGRSGWKATAAAMPMATFFVGITTTCLSVSCAACWAASTTLPLLGKTKTVSAWTPSMAF